MSVKLKYKGVWMDEGEAAACRERDRNQPVELPPPVDPATLPERKDLDPDVPLKQLFFERPEVRAYVTEDGKMRTGLTPTQRATAEEIFKRYGGMA